MHLSRSCVQGSGVFEKTKARPGDKRKKARNQDAADIDGFLGPWAKFKDEKTVICPTEVRPFQSGLAQLPAQCLNTPV